LLCWRNSAHLHRRTERSPQGRKLGRSVLRLRPLRRHVGFDLHNRRNAFSKIESRVWTHNFIAVIGPLA
jgi:hypothetical protein